MKSHFEILVAKTFLFGPRYIWEGTRYNLALDYEENTRREFLDISFSFPKQGNKRKKAPFLVSAIP